MNLIDFILITIGYLFVCSAVFIFIPFSFYKVIIHIKLYGVNTRLKNDHMFKNEKPIKILIFELILMIGGIYFLLFEGKLINYIKNINNFFE